jgi:hypothetical protein
MFEIWNWSPRKKHTNGDSTQFSPVVWRLTLVDVTSRLEALTVFSDDEDTDAALEELLHLGRDLAAFTPP